MGAIFGFNIVVSVITVVLLRKVIPGFDVPSILLKGYYRFYAPSEQDCRDAAGRPEKKIVKDKKKKHTAPEPDSKTFVIPKDAEVPLYFAPVKPEDFCFLHFYAEFCWLVEYSTGAAIVYFVTIFTPEEWKWKSDSFTDDLKLHNLWLLLGALFCAINLSRMSSKYIGSSGETSMLVMFGTFCFVGVLAALSLPSRVIELGYEELVSSLARVSKLGLTLFISLFSALFGSAFAFPGFRGAQMNRDATRHEFRPLMKMLLHGAFYSPLLIPLTFYPKLFRTQLKEPTATAQIAWLPAGLDDVLVDRIQLGLIIVTSLWKISFWKPHIQSYLAVAKNRIEKLRKREKSYTNIDVSKNITVVWYYSLVAVLQYLLPSILLIFLALIYKSASGLTFYGPLQPQWENPNGMDKLPAGSWAVLFKFLIWLVSSSHALAVIGGYAFHSIIDTDL